MTAETDPTDRRSPGAAALGLAIEHVEVFHGANHVLKDVSLDIRPGEFFAFLGPSGCGKTTLLRLVAGFHEARSGTVRLGGRDLGGLPPWRRDIGLVFQSYALWPHMTVAQNVAFGPEERRLPREEIRNRVREALALVGLTDYAGRRPSQLSGGQQQRVALARTLAIRPKLLLLDEPLSNLDAQMRVQVRRDLLDLQRRLGLTTIFVTHDQEEANTICDRIAVLRDGTVQQVGTPIELYRRPANHFVAGFLGTANLLPGASGPGRLFALAGGGTIERPVGSSESARALFRPQDARLVGDGVGPGAEEILLPGTIAQRHFLGSTLRYAIACAGGEIQTEESFRSGAVPAEIGDAVTVAVSPRDLVWVAA